MAEYYLKGKIEEPKQITTEPVIEIDTATNSTLCELCKTINGITIIEKVIQI